LLASELRSIILLVVGFSIRFPAFFFKISIEFGLFTSSASCLFINVWQSDDMDFVVDLVWEGQGDFFGFKHDVKANGFHVLSIKGFLRYVRGNRTSGTIFSLPHLY